MHSIECLSCTISTESTVFVDSIPFPDSYISFASISFPSFLQSTVINHSSQYFLATGEQVLLEVGAWVEGENGAEADKKVACCQKELVILYQKNKLGLYL